MAKIKHIALTTHDLEKVASFYKEVFGMAEVGRGGSTHIYLSDGDLNLTIRACKKSDDLDVRRARGRFQRYSPHWLRRRQRARIRRKDGAGGGTPG